MDVAKGEGCCQRASEDPDYVGAGYPEKTFAGHAPFPTCDFCVWRGLRLKAARREEEAEAVAKAALRRQSSQRRLRPCGNWACGPFMLI